MSTNCRFATATHIATLLADGPRDALGTPIPMTSERLAGYINTNPVVVRRLLGALARAGLVHSQRGSAGGTVLTRAPDTITLADLYDAVDADDRPATHHPPSSPNCPVGRRIVPVLGAIIDTAEHARRQELARITVAEVLARVHAPEAPSAASQSGNRPQSGNRHGSPVS